MPHISCICRKKYCSSEPPEHIRRELVECAKMVSQLDARMLALNEEIQTLGEEKESGTAGG